MICSFMKMPLVTNLLQTEEAILKTNKPIPDPEAIALSKVYALLIRAARQRKMTQTKAEENVEMRSVPISSAAETHQSRDFAKVPPPTTG